MLQDIRDNSQGIIAKIIVIAVVVSLSIFGIDAIVGGFSGEPSVATVNGTDITEREFERGVQIRRQELLQEMDRPDPALLNEGKINREVLDNLVDRTLLYQDAQERGLDLSDAEIDQLITSVPQFQVDGQFNQERFIGFVRNQGMGVQEFRQALRRNYLIGQVQNVLTAGAFTSPDAAQNLLALQQQSRSFATLPLDPSLVAEQVSVSDDEVESFYTKNSSQFMRPETVDVAWIELNRSEMKDVVNIPEEKVRELYQQRIKLISAQEERKAAHILLIPESGDEVADERIAEVEAALQDEDFAAIAERLSDDPGSAREGGDLGYATRESYDQAFAEALFSMESEGNVVGPVESSYGVHFIKLLDVRTKDKPSYEELQASLRDELARARANELYNERRERLADIAFSAFDLKEPAAEVNAEIKRTEGITQKTAPEPFDHPGLIRQIFSEDVLQEGNNTELVEVSDGQAVVARVIDHTPQQKLPLAEVKDEIRQTLRTRKIQEALNEKAREWIVALKEGAEPETVAAEAGAEWGEYSDVQRGSEVVPASVLAEAFRLPHPEGGSSYGRANTESGVTLIRLNSVNTPSVDQSEPVLAAVDTFLERQQGNQASRLYLEALREQAEIEEQ